MRRVFNQRVQILDSNGDPEVGAKLEFFAAGTANQLDTFDDYALSSANTNPVITDAGGWCTVFLQKNVLYDYTTVDSDDVTIYAKVTNVSGIEPPVNTKGDLFGFDTDFQRIAIGTNAQVLTADSSVATGIKWANQASDATVTTKGDIYTYDTAAARLPAGNDNSILVADSAETTGLKWVAALVRATSSSTLALTASTWTTIQLNTETQDSDAIYNNSTYTATIADAGWYTLFASCTFATDADSANLRLLLNGTDGYQSDGGPSDDHQVGISRYLAASTTIVVQAFHNTSSNTMAAGALFQLRRYG